MTLTTTPRPCLVIGASGDIGRAIAERLLSDGRPVALTHSPRGRPPATLAPRECPGTLRWYSHEARHSDATDALVSAVQRDFGSAPDLVYCAGVARDRALTAMSDADWDEVLATNLTGAFYAARALAKELMLAGNGRMVFIGSVAAAKGNPGQANYAASKGGLDAMCRELAVELGRYGITCNVVSPGLIEGRMVSAIPPKALAEYVRSSPLRRVGQAADVAAVVSLLLSAQGQYVSGQTIQVDGGLTAM